MNTGNLRDIKDYLRKLGGNGGSWFATGEVKSVGGETCTVQVGGLVLEEVWLTGVHDQKEKSLVVTPKVGSMVLMADMSGGELRQLVVVGYTEVERIVVNGGEKGGLVNIEELKNWMGNVERDLNTLKSLLSTTPVAGNGAPLGIAFAPSTQSVASKIEDESIKH